MTKLMPDRIRRGECAELRFMARAAEEGLTVAKPLLTARYDVLVSYGNRIQRVQVKATSTAHRRRCYMANVARRTSLPPGSKGYRSDEIDFFALYVIPEDAWYIVPIGVVAGLRTCVCLSPSNPRSKYNRYLEAWHLLRDYA